MTKIDLYNAGEFIAWRNGLYGFFEKALYDALIAKKDKVMMWNAPDIYFLTMRDSILVDYASIDTRTKLESESGEIGLYLMADKRAVLERSSEVSKSLVLKRMMEWHRIAIWSCMAAYHGSYESVARELRFLIEDSAQSLYADQKKPTNTIDEKVTWLKTNRLRGSKLIDAIDFPLSLKEKLKSIYSALSDYVHPSVELIQRDIRDKRVYFDFFESWFDKMLEFSTTVFDLALSIVMFCFPKVIGRFLSYQSIEELRKDGYVETIAMIELLSDSSK